MPELHVLSQLSQYCCCAEEAERLLTEQGRVYKSICMPAPLGRFETSTFLHSRLTLRTLSWMRTSGPKRRSLVPLRRQLPRARRAAVLASRARPPSTRGLASTRAALAGRTRRGRWPTRRGISSRQSRNFAGTVGRWVFRGADWCDKCLPSNDMDRCRSIPDLLVRWREGDAAQRRLSVKGKWSACHASRCESTRHACSAGRWRSGPSQHHRDLTG